MRKKVDSRIKTLIENCQKLKQRGIFVIIGDRGRDQVVNLHYLMSKMNMIQRMKVLWCYKKELGFSTHKQKRIKQIKTQLKQGLYDSSIDEPFDLFISGADIRYCFYNETQNILGNTYDMLILQDFESLTPNIVCRTVETISGGGIVFILLKSMTSLKQLYSMSMDVHNKFRTDAHNEVEPRFNERFILSLATCKTCIFMDDEMNLLPINSSVNEIEPISKEETKFYGEKDLELDNLKKSLAENEIVGPLVNCSRTLDQAKVIMTYVDVLNDKTARNTVFLSASRGRGKSVAMGLGLAAAMAKGYSNVFVTAPSPENLKTLFEFLLIGLEKLDFKENLHYEVIKGSEADTKNCIVRVNLYSKGRQIIQYVKPSETDKILYAELVVIDEAAAIPLPIVKKMIGPWPLFISSTIHGYEGTGRSLSLKLIQQLKENNSMSLNSQDTLISDVKVTKSSFGSRVVKEITMVEPIRYSIDDKVEQWMYDLLCLHSTNADPIKYGLPHPQDCELYLVNKDTLFSFNKSSERFLNKVMSLFISSHYKNSPNDLQLLSDAPAHSVFVLMPSNLSKVQKGDLPDILCVLQTCFEGQISSKKVVETNTSGIKPSGD